MRECLCITPRKLYVVAQRFCITYQKLYVMRQDVCVTSKLYDVTENC
jgi:hypothetical protein